MVKKIFPIFLGDGGGIYPTGTINIPSNDIYDVTEYEYADVDVEYSAPVLSNITYTPNYIYLNCVFNVASDITPTYGRIFTNNNLYSDFKQLQSGDNTIQLNVNPGYTYDCRLDVFNYAGITHSSYQTITIPPIVPQINSESISNVTDTTADAAYNVFYDGGAAVTRCGVCYSTSQNPTVSDTCVAGDPTLINTIQTVQITGLTPSTTYYARFYAENSAGIRYSSNNYTFTTDAPHIVVPTVSISNIYNTTDSQTDVDYSITDNGGGTIIRAGICYSTSQNPTISDNYIDDPNLLSSNTLIITGLNASTTYYARAYAENSAGLSYSSNQNFTTTAPPINYFYIENAYNGQNTVSINLAWYGDYPNLRTTDLAYSKNGNVWTPIDVSKPSGSTSKTISVVLNEGERVYVRSSTGLSIYNSSSSYSRISFHGSNAINVGGNISTLINYTDPDSVTTVRTGELYYLFHTTSQYPASVVDISNLSLGNITTLEANAMNGFLYGQSMLTSALDLTSITSTQSASIANLYNGCSLIDEAWTPNVTRNAAGSNWLYNTASSGVVHIPSGLCVGTSSGCIRENSANGIPSGWTYQTY